MVARWAYVEEPRSGEPEEIEAWCSANLRHPYAIGHGMVAFEDAIDATCFRIWFG